MSLKRAVVGMSGCGKTYFQAQFEQQQSDWETYSVDAEIAERLNFYVMRLVFQTLKPVGLSLDASAEEIKASTLDKNTQGLIAEGLQNLSDPENLSLQTLWQQFSELNAVIHAAFEEAVLDYVSVKQFEKPVYVSTPGSVINAPDRILSALKKKFQIIYIALDTPQLIEKAIAQMSGKPILLTLRQQAKKETLNCDQDFARWFVADRAAQYEKIAHITLGRSGLEDASSDDFLELLAEKLR